MRVCMGLGGFMGRFSFSIVVTVEISMGVSRIFRHVVYRRRFGVSVVSWKIVDIFFWRY